MTIVLDTSGSMEGERLKDLIEAAQTLVKSLRDQDAAALITFAEAVQFKVPVTHDRERLLASLTGLNAAGFTSLYDAAFLAMQLRPLETFESRPVMLVFSDGHDNTSWLRAAQLLEATRRSRTLTHVVELVGASTGTPFRTSDFLGDLASAGGGRRWTAQSSRDLRDLFGKVLNELRSRYLLAYTPKGVARGRLARRESDAQRRARRCHRAPWIFRCAAVVTSRVSPGSSPSVRESWSGAMLR